MQPSVMKFPAAAAAVLGLTGAIFPFSSDPMISDRSLNIFSVTGLVGPSVCLSPLGKGQDK